MSILLKVKERIVGPSGCNREFFWRELNIGWYEMCEMHGIAVNDTSQGATA